MLLLWKEKVMKDKFLMAISYMITFSMCVVIVLSVFVEIPADMPTMAVAGTLITIDIKIIDYFIKKRKGD